MTEEDDPPPVTVLIPSYNAEKFIKDAIQSVLDQTYKDFLLYIVDDNSTDRTIEIVKSFNDKRIKIFRTNCNTGKACTLNSALPKVKTKYVTFLDSDDMLVKDKLEKQVNFLEENEDVDMVFGDFATFEGKIVKGMEDEYLGNLKKSSKEEITRPSLMLSKKGVIGASSPMLRRKIIEKIKFDENSWMEDYDFWFQVIGKGFKIKYVPGITYYYREHDEQKTKDKNKYWEAANYLYEKLKRGDYF